MGWVIPSVTILALLFTALALGIPIAFSIGTVSLIGIGLFVDLNAVTAIANIAWSSSNNFTLTAVPLFMLMSEVIMYTGIGTDMFKTMEKWFGRLPGGLAIGGIVSSAIFGAVSGTAIGVAAIVGGIAIPEMKRAGYSNRVACGSIAAASTLGMLIPPSMPMITYGVITETSVGQLFIAGIIPGIVLCGLYCAYTIFSSRKEKNVSFVRYSWPEKFASLLKILPVVLLIILVIGSIYGGFATPTEAAGVGAVGAVVVAACMRRLKLNQLFHATRNACKTCAMVILIMLNAQVFSYLLTSLRLPQMLNGGGDCKTGRILCGGRLPHRHLRGAGRFLHRDWLLGDLRRHGHGRIVVQGAGIHPHPGGRRAAPPGDGQGHHSKAAQGHRGQRRNL